MLQNLLAVRQQISVAATRAGRSANEVCLIAVSKTRSLAEVQQAVASGQGIFGENQVQDALTKIPALSYPQAEWHFIGHLQSNKVKYIPGNFQWLHTLGSIRLAERLNTAMQLAGKSEPLNCLLQVNVSAEKSKSGIAVDEVDELLAQLLKQSYPLLKIRGLMTIGVRASQQQTRAAFSSLRECRDACRARYKLADFDQLSMGMSDDFEIAIEEGSTMVRIGSRIFGQREPV